MSTIRHWQDRGDEECIEPYDEIKIYTSDESDNGWAVKFTKEDSSGIYEFHFFGTKQQCKELILAEPSIEEYQKIS